jgi:ABC-type transport system involved in cytochrome c biogenesis permease subunit
MLIFHIAMIFSAYALLTAACIAGLAFLLQEWMLKHRRAPLPWAVLPSLDQLEAFVHRMILWAFPLLTIGIVFGAFWARREWGRYWGWDPKETFAFVTWLVYGIYLLIRHSGWRGRKSVYLSLGGFLLVLCTGFWVNRISPLHRFGLSASSVPAPRGPGMD